MNQNIAPTSEFLAAILWLGGTSRSGDDVPIGSGVVVHHKDQEYLATALHVARSCAFQPFIRRSGLWNRPSWETVGTNEDADVAVLKTSSGTLSGLTPQYGFSHVYIGAIGRAMGFPAITDPTEISHIGEMAGLPIPLTALVASYFRPQQGTESDIHYAGGYINGGFSGGAMLFPTSSGWSIAGIITHREGFSRQTILRRNVATGIYEPDDNFVVNEPSGLIRFAGFGTITNLIEGTST